MSITVEINGSTKSEHHYINWTPVECSIRLDQPEAQDVAVTLKNEDPASGGGQVVFLSARDAEELDELPLNLPADGTPATFFVAGKFGHHSIDGQDATISVNAADESQLVRVPLMVRVRRNANEMQPVERDAFLTALAGLNADPKNSIFHDLYMYHHSNKTNALFHGVDSFFPWHRGYILALERALQEIDPVVSLPYWRFDVNAPEIFKADFLGETTESSFPQKAVFSDTNPLKNWTNFDGTNLVQGVMRSSQFDTSSENSNSWEPDETWTQKQALDYSGTFRSSSGTRQFGVAFMENRYHNWAHNSFRGDLPNPNTAPRDPLFFLLHCNVDRFWSLWQLKYKRFDKSEVETYFFQGTFDGPDPKTQIASNLKDTFWPWNGKTSSDNPTYPDFAQPNGYRQSPMPPVHAPTTQPQLGEVMDYMGIRDSQDYLGYGYDDVPFDIEA